MKIGINALVNHDPKGTRGATAELLQDQVRQAKLAEEVGLDSFWCAEHHVGAHGGLVPSNAILAAAIASATRRIRIGSGAAILTLHDPYEVAAQWSMIDCLSGGRVEFGMGRAFLPVEFQLFEVDMEESRARFEEGVDLVRHLWKGEDVRFEGQFRKLPSVGPLSPLPVQTPHPPLWVTAAMSPESFVYAGKNGFGLIVTPWAMGLDNMLPLLQLYCDSYAQAGHRLEDRRIQASYFGLLHEDRDLAQDRMRVAFGRSMKIFAESIRAVPYPGKAYAAYAAMAESMGQLDVEPLLQEKRLLVGTSDDVVRQIEAIAEKAPMITSLTVGVDLGMLDRELVYGSITRLGRDVLPRVRRLQRS